MSEIDVSVTASLRMALAERLMRRRAHEPRGAAPSVRRHTRAQAFPLSFAQERMWCVEQMEPGSHLYNTIDARLVEGPVDRALLEASVNEIVRRHEVLRSVIRNGADGPVQLVVPQPPLLVPAVDLDGIPDEQQAAFLQRAARDEGGGTFELGCGPLLRIVLFRLRPRRHIVWIAFHHIVADGWSTSIFEHELKTIYSAFQHGQPSPLPRPPAVQYRHFAAWQRCRLTDTVLAPQLERWRENLRDAPRAVDLPRRGSSTHGRSHAGAREPIVIDAVSRQGLEEIARREDVTPFIVLLASFGAALSWLTGQRDIVVGTPISERQHPSFENLIGCFLNTLVLRLRLEGNPTWRELLVTARDAVVAAHAGRDVPFQRLMQHLRPSGAASLFNVWLTLVNTPASDGPAVLEPWRALPFDPGVAQFDIAFVLMPQEATLTGFVEYNRDLLDATAVSGLVRDFQSHLRGIATTPDLPVFDPRARNGSAADALPGQTPDADVNFLF